MPELRRTADDFVVAVCEDALRLSREVEDEVANLWSIAVTESGGRLFDEAILRVVAIEETRVVVAPIPYRLFYVARLRPDLIDPARLTPLAVTGMSSCEQGVVFGRRSPHVTQAPGLIELLPSGSVPASRTIGAKVDFSGQLLEELEEEAGVSSDAVEAVRLLGVVDAMGAEGVVDLAVSLRLRLSQKELLAAHAARGSDEYVELMIVDFEEVAEHRERWGRQLTPVSDAILRGMQL